jgi:ligand-binding sensor domain-containing protein
MWTRFLVWKSSQYAGFGLRLVRHAALLLLLLFVRPEPSAGQVENFAFEHLTVEQGLLRPTVYSMAQDSRGFIWFGTPGGLCRYDGNVIRLYTGG